MHVELEYLVDGFYVHEKDMMDVAYMNKYIHKVYSSEIIATSCSASRLCVGTLVQVLRPIWLDTTPLSLIATRSSPYLSA